MTTMSSSQFRRFPLASVSVASHFAMLAALLLAVAAPVPGSAQLSKGYQMILSHGLQLQGMVQYNDYFHWDTYQGAGYNTINWIFTSNPDWMGPPPGYPWARWASDETNMPPAPGEEPFMSQLFGIELGDEWNIDDDATRTRLVNWFTSVRSRFPSAVLYHNNYGGQASDSALGDLIARAHPDMLCFDQYPFLSDYNTRVAIGGPFTSWYSELRRYRAWALSAGIPYAAYMQTFHSVEDYDQRVYRNPSPSELRLNTSVALAFNAKELIGFTYNTGATSLFDILPNGYSGDNYTNALYAEQADVNRRAANLGKALVALTPLYELHNQNDVNPPPGLASGDPCGCLVDSTVTSIMILRGRYLSGGVTNATPVPISFVNDPASSSNPANPNALIYTWWEYQKNDPYLTGWSVTNKAGLKNNGLPGDVFIAWFRPLDENFDGPTYSNEVYMMVVNGLTDPTGSAADCMQEIKLNFVNGFSSIVLLDPETGLLQTNTLPVVSTRRQLVLDLNGGDAALFKFADGAPFVGRVQPEVPRLGLQMQPGGALLSLQGTQGARYLLQSSTSLPATNWTTLTNLLLPAANFQCTDPATGNNGARFYRALGVY